MDNLIARSARSDSSQSCQCIREQPYRMARGIDFNDQTSCYILLFCTLFESMTTKASERMVEYPGKDAGIHPAYHYQHAIFTDS